MCFGYVNGKRRWRGDVVARGLEKSRCAKLSARQNVAEASARGWLTKLVECQGILEKRHLHSLSLASSHLNPEMILQFLWHCPHGFESAFYL